MKKHIIDEKTGINYTLVGDYYIPDLKLPESETQPIGMWGRKHLKFIKEYRTIKYNVLILRCELNSYLANINREAEEMLERLIEQMAKAEGITEQLKADNQMDWVGMMNNIRNRAEEIINQELIFI